MEEEQESSEEFYSDEYSGEDTDSEEEDEEEEEEVEEEEGDDDVDKEGEREREPLARGKSVKYTTGSGKWKRGRVLDPRSTWVHEWNGVFLILCATGLFVDPFFLYTLSVSGLSMCLLVDGWLAITVTVVRTMTDLSHLWNMWLLLRMAKRRAGGTRVATSRRVALRYVKSIKGFFFDLFVILPVPQVVLWVVVPQMMKREGSSLTRVMDAMIITFSIQYIPKIYHSVRHLLRVYKNSDYLFGTIWWGFALNLIAYFVAANAAGGCWYVLAVQRTMECLEEQCGNTTGCEIGMLSCKEPVYFGTSSVQDTMRLDWENNEIARSSCLDSSSSYSFGVYQWAIQVVSNGSRLEKILLPIFWGLMNLSTFGNLTYTTVWTEIVFNIVVLTCALLLLTMTMSHIKVVFHATTSKKNAMHLKRKDIELWMKKKRLPKGFRKRVRACERHRWAAMRGVDVYNMIHDLPEGLRRDIKYHLCLDLVRQVPLFQHMDTLVLENICDRVNSLIFTKGEVIQKEGDLVQRMIFVVRGHLQSSQTLRDGVKSHCMLGPGNFVGDELLPWCLRRPFVQRLPSSSSTLVTLETTEAFVLEAEDVQYVTQHFRHTFVSEKVKRSACYYSPGWRTWAAVAIQLAWRRYRKRLTLASLSFIRPRRPLSRSASLREDKLRLYTAMLTSPKPSQDHFDS